jgi:3-oxoacyl-[acyl-carrier-protein] synthase III
MTNEESDAFYDKQQKDAIEDMQNVHDEKLKEIDTKLDEIDQFLTHLEKASKVVATWPEWKQNILGGSPPPLDK